MRRYCFCLVVAAISLAPCIPAVATALDDYVNAPDPAYNWSLFATYPGAGYTHYILHMDSQTWLTASEVDRTVWEHEIVVTVPDTVSHDTAHLHIDGGSTTTVTTNNITELTAMAVETESIVARLRQVPNQPLTFVDGVPRTEDSLIAYGWDQFLRGGREEWLARFPMTKAAVRAMDAVSDFVATQFGGALAVNSFVVSGASKRGWTAWTTAAVDPRVVAVAPMVIDLLNLNPSFTHHYAALGYWAPA
ncbi:MAG: PhoPQ-activated pathogenicity, partial [Candidatus Hydrogenedentes bacterium]|nr:PhoPQ-activated pathogenicity [Candidatus Hydrogenedentota bacterium]